MKRLYILWMGILLILAATHTHAQVVFNATNFPDANFRQYLKDNFSSYGFTTEGVTISADNLNSITLIACNSRGITNLKGIEYFTKITKLQCHDNQLTSLNLSNNTELYWVQCYANQLTSLILPNTTTLTYLWCSSNQLTSLDVSKLNLETLLCYYNKISSLNLNNSTKLKTLKCQMNQITGELNLRNSTLLTGLECYENKLSGLDVTQCTKLTLLRCYINSLSELNVTNNTKLTELSCYYNKLSELNLSNNTELRLLNCSYNELATLDLSNNTKLTELSCYYNKLSELNLSNNTELRLLNCSYNELATLDLSNNTKLTDLDVSFNSNIRFDLSKNTALERLACYFCNLTKLDLSKNTEIKDLQCQSNGLRSLDLSKQTKLTRLSVTGQSVKAPVWVLSNTSLGVPYSSEVNPQLVTKMWKYNSPTSTETVGFTNEQIESDNCHIISSGVSFEDINRFMWDRYGWPILLYDYDIKCGTAAFANTRMDVEIIAEPYVTCGENNRGSGNFPDANFRTALRTSVYDKDGDNKLSRQELIDLIALDVSNMNITTMRGIEYMKYLQTLDCSGNKLSAATDLPLTRTNNNGVKITYNAELLHLNCSNNQLTGIDVTCNNKMQILDCSYNKITGTLNVEKTKLIELNCGNNELTDFVLPNARTLLVKLTCNDNRLSSLSSLVSYWYTNLTTLDCSGNLLSKLDVNGSSKLEMLDCHNNQLTSLSLPPYSAPLQSLNCNTNRLTALSNINRYTKLTTLDCGNNLLATLILDGNTKLETLRCHNNELTALDVTKNTLLTDLRCQNNHLRTLDLSKNASLTELNCANQTSTEDVSVFDYNKIGVYLPTGGKKANFVGMKVAGAAQAADVLTSSGKQYLVVNPTPTGDVDLYGKTVTYSYNTECPSTAITNKNMTGVTITTYPYVMWVNPNSKSVSGNYYSGTIVLDYDAVVPAGTEVYVITGLKATPRDMMYDGTKYSMQQFNMQRIAVAGQVVPKNTPVYVKSDTQDGLFAFGRNTTNATPVAVPSGNLLKGSATAAVSVDSYGALTLGREKKTGEVGFWQNKATSIPAHRCYLDASILNATNGAKGAVFCFEQEDEGYGEATSVDAVDNSQPTNDNWHSLDGRKLNGKPATKGIYIHNGRKEVVR